MTHWVKENVIVLILFAIASFITILPQLYIQYPSLIDDGTDMLEARSSTVTQILKKSFFVDDRTRPLDFLFLKARYELFHTNMPLYYALNAVIVWLIVVCTFILFRELKISKRMALLFSLLVFFLPSLYANTYRLGTMEHVQALLVLLGTILLQKQRGAWAIAVFAINCGFKETGIFYLIIPVVWFVLNKNKNRTLLLSSLIVFFVCAALLGYKQSMFSKGYSGQSTLNLTNITIVAAHNSLYFFGLIAAVMLVLLSLKQKARGLQSLTWLLVLTVLVSAAPFFIWQMTMKYYYFPSQVWSMILISIVALRVIQLAKRESSRLFLIILSFTLLVLTLGDDALAEAMKDHQELLGESALVGYILNHPWRGYTIYSAVDHYERNHKLYVYFVEWLDQDQQPKAFIPDITAWLQSNP